MSNKEFLEQSIMRWKNSPERHMQIKGHLYYDNEHDILMRKRTMIGEDGKLQVVENLPNNRNIDNQYASDSPFKGVIKTCEGFDAFRRLETTFDPHFGLILSNFYIFGANPNWGIYLCEYPAIKLIGCIDRYIPAFKDAFNIRGTGFEEVEPLLEQEFGQNRNFQDKLIENYHL